MDKAIKQKLTIKQLQENNKKYELIKKITVLDSYFLNVKPYVSVDNMNRIISEFGFWIQDKKIQEILIEKDRAEENEAFKNKQLIKYFICFVIKVQTDLFESMEFKGTNLELLDIFDILLNCNAVDEIMIVIDKKDTTSLLEKFNSIINISKKVDEISKIKESSKNENK